MLDKYNWSAQQAAEQLVSVQAKDIIMEVIKHSHVTAQSITQLESKAAELGLEVC